MADTMELFGSALSEIADGPAVGSHAALTKALMQRMAEKGATLEHLTDRRMMKRSIGTLQKKAREFGLSFPDYVPMALRRKVEFKRRGDFYEADGPGAFVANEVLGLIQSKKRDGTSTCAIPAHRAVEWREALVKAWVRVKGLPHA